MNPVLQETVDAFLALVDEADAQDRVEARMKDAMADPRVGDAIATYDTVRSLEDMAIHRSEKLTVLVGVLPSGFSAGPHNHNIWSVVGVARGREDNEFFERRAGGLKKVGERNVEAPGTLANPPEAIHAIANNVDSPLFAMHAYGGDLFATPRSNWDPDTHDEIPFDWEKVSSELRD